MYLFTMRLKYLLLLCLLSAGNMAYAQNTLKGIYIIDTITKVPVQDALIQSEDARFTTSADENGFVSFKNLPASLTRLTISRIGGSTNGAATLVAELKVCCRRNRLWDCLRKSRSDFLVSYSGDVPPAKLSHVWCDWNRRCSGCYFCLAD